MLDAAKSLIDEVLQAHGGRDLWIGVDRLVVEVSINGFLFTAKMRRALKHVIIEASALDPSLVFRDYPAVGQRSELIGDAEVRILGSDGSTLQGRSEPREAFHGLRRIFRWDDLDFAYFGGYAMWNYLVTPFIFLREGFTFEHLGQRETPAGTFTCLRATFPQDIPTHNRVQIFYFDASRLLRRVDYTAEVVGGWAHAAHFCDEYRDFSGLKFPTRRRVLPTMFKRVIGLPTIVAIDIHDVRVRRR